MFFVVSKILAFLISPLTWVFVLLLLAVVLRKEKLKKRLLLSALIVFWFFSNGFIAAEFMRLWEPKVVHESSLKPKYDVLVVLGGGMMTADVENNTTAFRDNTDRIFQSLRLYKQGRAEKILISSGAGNLHYRNMLEAVLLRDYLVEIGANRNDIWIDSISDNTYQNAVNSSKMIKDSVPNGNVLLVTSASHIMRAKACFDRQNIKIDVYPVDFNTGTRLWSFSNLFLPKISAIRMWEELLHEIVGCIVYKINGYI